MDGLEQIVRQSLTDFVAWVSRTGWYGREREAVSLYVMGFLVKQCKPGTILSDPTQIGIEVAVPQLPGARRKKLVTKDVVIWNRPGMTCWSEDRLSTNHPLCIMEWKRGEDSIAARRDIDWLRAYSTTVEGLLGFSVVLGLGPDGPRLRCVCVNAGKIAKEWLIL